MTPKDLRTRRLNLGLSTEELACGFGLTTFELEEMERGQNPLPPEEFLLQAFERIEASARNRVRDCLVVEDDEVVRTMFVRALRAEGLTVDEAADGLAAIDATAMRDYRLLLLDLLLPKFSGAEVLQRVLMKPKPPANVIIISAAESGDVREVAHHRAVHAVMRKSFAIANAEVVFPALAELVRS